jgi:4-diphosphocytidyl-2-C-methyl-D-erythritol kinase
VREAAPAKVNLCLFLGPLRDDGRHELVTLFESISLSDELSLTQSDVDEVICSGVDGPNLVSAALLGLRDRGWTGPPVRIEVRKRIPVAAGLGGGSADAAAALRLAQRLAPVPEDTVRELATELGADVPSQLRPGLALGTGAGELIEPFPPLEPHAFVIVPQPVALSTADVYREADRLRLPRPSLEGMRERLLACGAARLPPELLVNDLEAATLSLCPEVATALKALREAGLDHAIVCGSGPTVAGLCWGADAPGRAQAIARQLAPRFPAAVRAVPVSSCGSGTIEGDA